MAEATLPGPVLAQLQAILRRHPEADRIALVWPEPIEPAESSLTLGGATLRLVYCPSELAMRERLVQHAEGEERIVLLSPFDETKLGKDLLARLWGFEPKRINAWRTLEESLQVRQIDPRLTGKNYRWIAECLVNTLEKYRSQINFGEVLDFDQAWQALAIGQLDYREAVVDLDALFNWSLQGNASETAKVLPEQLQAHLSDWLAPRIGAYDPLVRALWASGHAGDMLAIGVVCSLIYRDGREQTPELFQARGRLVERFLGSARLADDTLRDYGTAAVVYLERLSQQRANGERGKVLSRAEQLPRAEQVLASLDLLPWAIESDLLPAAFAQRLDRFATALKRTLKGHDIATAITALNALQNHWLAEARHDQVYRATLALRCCAWLQTEQAGQPHASGLINHFVDEGGYVDWARSRIWSGDEHEALSRLYDKISQRVAARREALNEQFAQHLPAIARGDCLQDDLILVEDALNKLVVPLAQQKQRVLLLVLDGMSQGVYRELGEDLVAQQWVELQRDSASGPGCLLAALPTLTRSSRYSLLAGQLGEGQQAEEKKAFKAHAGLKSLTSTRHPPTLFHKGELQQPGSGALADNVRQIIAGQEHRVVGAVINVIDDQLSSSDQLAVNWTVESISLLRQLLEAARESGRVVVITSDHGHVLDHAMQYVASNSDAERFKLATETVKAGELLVQGPRVLQPGQQAVLPWSEKLRYASRKKGYHGGGSLQEVIIPLGIYRNAGEQEPIEGYREVPRREPAWWHMENGDSVPKPMTSSDREPPKQAKSKTQRRDARTADIFESIDNSSPDASGSPSGNDAWLVDLLASPVYEQMRARLGRTISDEQLSQLLSLLQARGGQQMTAALVQALGVPAIRMNGFLAGAQKLLNVDGYPVLSVDRTTKTVSLNMESLKTQFEL